MNNEWKIENGNTHMIYLEIWFRFIINLAPDTFIIFNPLVKIDSISTTDDIQSLTRKSVTRINHKGNISMKNNKVVDKKMIQKYIDISLSCYALNDISVGLPTK